MRLLIGLLMPFYPAANLKKYRKSIQQLEKAEMFELEGMGWVSDCQRDLNCIEMDGISRFNWTIPRAPVSTHIFSYALIHISMLMSIFVASI